MDAYGWTTKLSVGNLYLQEDTGHYFFYENLTSLVVLVDIDEIVHIPPPGNEQSIVTVDMKPLPIGASSVPPIFSLPCSPTPSLSTATPATAVDSTEMAPSATMEDCHICFLINEMQKAIVNEEHPPNTLMELDRRITECKGTKNLNKAFSSNFVWSAIQRKWISLVDTYKRKKDIIKRTGAAYVKFKYVDKLDGLLGELHDITPTVISGPSGVVYQQAMEPTALQNDEPLTQELPDVATPQRPQPEGAPRRRRIENDRDSALIDFFRQQDVEEDRFRVQLLQEMASTRQVLERALHLFSQMD